MSNRCLIIANHLRPFVGDLADELVAVELFKINREYINFQHECPSPCADHCPIEDEDLGRLLEHINAIFVKIIGERYAARIVAEIEADLGSQRA